MKITEKALLDNYTGITNGGDKISTIDGQKIIWNYRYIHGEGAAVCDQEKADIITLEYDRVGEIELTESNHSAFAKITQHENILFGDELEEIGL